MVLSFRRSLIFILPLLFVCRMAQAQGEGMFMADHDEKQYYFGITFGLNFSQYRIKYTESFTNLDTFKVIQPRTSPGFNLGIMANLRLSRIFDLRLIPSISFAEKKLDFSLPFIDSQRTRSIESIYIHLPLQVKLKSDRIGNFRFYGLAGAKFDYDLASNARSRKLDEFLKVKPVDLGAEAGFGFEFYNPNFIFSPEIKISQGLMNQLFRDPGIPLTNAIDMLSTRMIVISIHLEG